MIKSRHKPSRGVKNRGNLIQDAPNNEQMCKKSEDRSTTTTPGSACLTERANKNKAMARGDSSTTSAATPNILQPDDPSEKSEKIQAISQT